MSNQFPHRASLPLSTATRAQFAVVGRYEAGCFLPFADDERQFRTAYPNEVVECSGRFWRLVYTGRSFVGNEDVTERVAAHYGGAK